MLHLKGTRALQSRTAVAGRAAIPGPTGRRQPPIPAEREMRRGHRAYRHSIRSRSRPSRWRALAGGQNDAERGSHVHEVWQRSCVHLSHRTAAMRLDRDLADVEFVADLLVE